MPPMPSTFNRTPNGVQAGVREFRGTQRKDSNA